jgi:hypothetical protein
MTAFGLPEDFQHFERLGVIRPPDNAKESTKPSGNI